MNNNTKEFQKLIVTAQKSINVPKGNWNEFGKYKYRSCEDILSAAKPIIEKLGLFLSITDSVVLIGDRYYLRATATLTDGTSSVSSDAFAREPIAKKGMDESQITGTASSYARKFALSGLFGIDDGKEPEERGDEEQAMTKEDAIKLLRSRLTEMNKAEVDLLKYLSTKYETKLPKLEDLNSDQFEHAMSFLRGKK